MARLGTTSDPRTGARVINVHLCAGPSTQDDLVDLHLVQELQDAAARRFEAVLQLVQELQDAAARRFEAVLQLVQELQDSFFQAF
eukprot:jgi/Pico_ML_1/51249/g2312.t1